MSVKNPRHSDILQKSTPFLIENLYDVHDILDHLLASEVMSWDEKDDISSQATRRKRIEMLLNFLRVKDKHTFDIFLEALTYSGNDFVREELERVATQLEEEMLSATVVAQATESEEGDDWLANMSEEWRLSPLTIEAISLLSRRLSPYCFFHVGQLLGFSKSRLEQYQASDTYSVPAQFLKMLCDWCAKDSDKATLGRLVLVLRSSGIDDADYRDILEQQSASTGCTSQTFGSSSKMSTSIPTQRMPQWV